MTTLTQVKQSTRPFLKQILMFFVGAVLLGVMLKTQSLDNLSILLHTRPFFLCVLIFISLFIYMIGGITMTLFARAYEPCFSFWRGIKLEFIALMVENLTIGAAGKGTQMLLLHRQKLTWEQALCCVGFDFINFQMVTFCFSVLVFCDPFLIRQFTMEMPVVITGFICDIAPLVAAALLLYMPGIASLLHFLETKISMRPRRQLLSSLKKGARTLKQQRRIQQEPSRVFMVLISNFIRIFFRHSLPILAAYALGVEISPSLYIHLFIASIFIELMISVVPVTGKHGIAESVFLLICTPLLPEGTCLGVMILWRLAVYYIPTIFAILIFMLTPDITWKSLHQ